jgi:hypothetical protein
MKQITLPRISPLVLAHLALAAALSLAFQAAGAAAPAKAAADPVPAASLQPPQGETLYLEALAEGVQIYECRQKPDATYEWVFKAPEALLASRSGEPLGKHYAGPTWESRDGSKVAGDVRARDPGPSASAIPWLLLGAKLHSGTGVFSAAKSIQRLATVGGVAPSAPCSGSQLNQVARVPYTATYHFYR